MLTKRAAEILELSHAHPEWNASDMARALGLSRERIRQLIVQHSIYLPRFNEAKPRPAKPSREERIAAKRARQWDTFWSNLTAVDRGFSEPCLLWEGTVNSQTGYGCLSWSSWEDRTVHRAMARLLYGCLPRGFTVSHTCEVKGSIDSRRCVQPAHIVMETLRENLLRSPNRGRSRKFCNKGLHDLTVPGARTKWGKGTCRECFNARLRRQYQEKRAGVNRRTGLRGRTGHPER